MYFSFFNQFLMYFFYLRLKFMINFYNMFMSIVFCEMAKARQLT